MKFILRMRIPHDRFTELEQYGLWVSVHVPRKRPRFHSPRPSSASSSCSSRPNSSSSEPVFKWLGGTRVSVRFLSQFLQDNFGATLADIHLQKNRDGGQVYLYLDYAPGGRRMMSKGLRQAVDESLAMPCSAVVCFLGADDRPTTINAIAEDDRPVTHYLRVYRDENGSVKFRCVRASKPSATPTQALARVRYRV